MTKETAIKGFLRRKPRETDEVRFNFLLELLKETPEYDIDFKLAMKDNMILPMLKRYLDYNEDDFKRHFLECGGNLFSGYRNLNIARKKDYKNILDFMKNSGAFCKGKRTFEMCSDGRQNYVLKEKNEND